MTRILLIFILCISFPILCFSQKKAITHNDYDLWKSIKNVKISNQGKVIVTTIQTSTKRGNGHIEIYNTETQKKVSFSNGYKTSISDNEKYVVFLKKPDYQKIREEKRKKIKKENRKKSQLFIYDVNRNQLIDSINSVRDYELPREDNGWMIVTKYKNKMSKSDSSKKKNVSNTFKQKYGLVYRFNTKKQDTIYQLKDYVIPKNGKTLYYTTISQEKPKDKEVKDLGVYQYDIKSKTKIRISEGNYVYDKLATSQNGEQLAYISATDSVATDQLKFELYYYTKDSLHKLIDNSGSNLKNQWVLNKKQHPFFSDNGRRLYLYSNPKSNFAKDTTLLEEDIPQVDVWNWQDKMIQPEQKSKFCELDKTAFLSYYDIQQDKFIHFQDKNIEEIIFDTHKEQRFVLGATGSPYDVKRSWDFPRTKDFYIIDMLTGAKRLALKNTAFRPILSQDGNYAIYFDIYKQHWFSIHLKTLEKTNLTIDINEALYDEDNDRPMLPYPYGFGGFDKENNPLVYDKFDIWKLSLDGKTKPVNITKNGRKKNIQYRTEKLDKEEKHYASYYNDELLITSFDKTTKVSGLYTLQKKKLIEHIVPAQFLMNKYQKARNKELLVVRKQNFSTYPNLHIVNILDENSKQITNINTHQKHFKWGTAEPFSWKSYTGKTLEGIIYKPENFDPSKKYPLITYFYEKRSDLLNRYYAPQPSASTVNPSYLVSNDYIMFVPDVIYEEGKPGDSAYNCIVSGVEAVQELGYIDNDNIAIQGQSWGGYQVAYLITVTNKFKAAMAGAPVSNMTSAYGGIRWKSGLSRAFQYEKTQSRIGKNLWDGLEMYIENSPLFGIPKIETPLLMMHNDKDGAVPYYQGIEMFMGMRRLQKPVWLLVYNDEDHNLKKMKNKQDLSIRMMQFFDHYLKGKPAPEWMTKGVPILQKGKDFGYALDKQKD